MTSKYFEKGQKHRGWKGGQRSYQYRIYSKRAKTLPQKCTVCGTERDLVTHHKDGNFRNNEITNLEKICRACHRREHKKGLIK